jgi:hypothetical protein
MKGQRGAGVIPIFYQNNYVRVLFNSESLIPLIIKELI